MIKIFSFFNKKSKADKDIDIFLKQIEKQRKEIDIFLLKQIENQGKEIDIFLNQIEDQRQAAIKKLEYLTKVLNENK